MRVGQNPAKQLKVVSKPKRITVAVLNYIPFLSGYYADMLDVLKTCLGSIWENTDMPFDLLVFDNASCPEVRQYLVEKQSEGKIQYLILSETNLGKGGAWNIIFDGSPGEIIAYSDNDCFYYPNWLSASLKILESFPRVGMVTSRPVALNHTYNTQTLKWAENEPEAQIERGHFLDWETFNSFEMSLKGAVMASDAFFPFPDCVEIASQAGITSVIQPGGSIKDDLSIEFCDNNNMSMVTTGIRHFKH